MSAKCPLICSAVEIWYKMMLEIRNQSDLTENSIKEKPLAISDFLLIDYGCLWLLTSHHFPMQCVEHLVAQRIANLRVQKPEIAPFLPSENRFFRPSRAYVFVSAKIAVFTNIRKSPSCIRLKKCC